ncbi:hypothetical protein [Bradyrhizobium sp. Arg816]|uniref:hypothetical protein n=1 Tax=Bradyrhizobium sp. Arg816 TaxID=2998491 RepID=UPI00249E55A1|nr:hypothetical protein [Bradyrhizobium sp. Arg816]MDI3561283.1 hypothetical protein [Bradyrhizobium sp. Arg816]
MERSETVKMLISVTPEIRAWIEREAKSDDRTLSSVVSRALRSQMAVRLDREQPKEVAR